MTQSVLNFEVGNLAEVRDHDTHLGVCRVLCVQEQDLPSVRDLDRRL